jgi:hypothetical protein
MSIQADPYMSRYPDATQWTVSRFHHDRRSVFIRPDGSTSVPRWVADIRQILPLLQGRSPTELLESVRQSGGVDLGTISGRDAHQVSELLRQSASIIDVLDASSVSHFPKVDGGGLIIEDDAEGEAFCLRLIELGARVEDIQD